MRLRVSAPGREVSEADMDAVEKDLDKLDRRLKDYDLVEAEVRIAKEHGTPTEHVILELRYGPNHVVAGADHADWGVALRQAREEVLRQINDKSTRGHSDIAKGAGPR